MPICTATLTWFALMKFAVFFAMTCLVSSSAFAQNVTLESFIDSAAVQQDEIQSARIRLRHVNTLVPADSAPDVKQVEEAINEFFKKCEGSNEARAVELLKECLQNLVGRSPDKDWPQLTILQQGDDVRNVISIDSKQQRDWGVRKGTSTLHDDNLRFADIESEGSREYRYKIPYIRPILAKAPWEIDSGPGPVDGVAVLKLTSEGIETTAYVEEKTGVLVRWTVPGSYYRIRCKVVSYGDIALPTLGIDPGQSHVDFVSV